jgi:hypothetical protein
MHRAIKQLESNIIRVRALGGIFQALTTMTTPAVDASDILRSQIVMAVSALDHYVHELTLLGMLEVYLGVRQAPPAYLRFEVPVATAVPGISTAGSSWFEAIVRQKHNFLSFQHPDNVSAAIRLFSSCELWPTVSKSMGVDTQTLKNRLRLVVDRRNKIAHEADLDPSYPGVRWPISATDAAGVVNFIDDLCHQIHIAVTLRAHRHKLLQDPWHESPGPS